MAQIMDGYCSVVRIVNNHGVTLSFPIRHIQLTHFVLENQQHNFLHNEKLVVHFNYILDGKMNYVRFNAQIKLNNLHGIDLVFERDSTLRQISRHLCNTVSYDCPCDFIAEQLVKPAA